MARVTTGTHALVVFTIDGERYALPLEAVERVHAMVAVTPLPAAPEPVIGVVNVHGSILPVLDVRRRLGLPPRSYGPAARLLVARTPVRRVALAAHDVPGVAEVPEDRVQPAGAVFPGIGQVAGIAALPDGLLLIHDLGAFLSLDEERQLTNALGELAT